MQKKSVWLWLILGGGAIVLGMVLTMPAALAGPAAAPPAQATAAPTPEATPAATVAAPAATPTVAPTTTAPANVDYLYWIIGGAAVIVIAVAFAIWYTRRS